jgi:antitoxin VapB
MKTAKLFQNGQSQAVRLPKEFRLPGKEVYVKRVGAAVVLLPQEHSWDSLFEGLTQFSGDFMRSRRQPRPQKRDRLFE